MDYVILNDGVEDPITPMLPKCVSSLRTNLVDFLSGARELLLAGMDNFK